MTVKFDGQVVIVTGAAQGQGAEHAKKLSSAGARVVLTDIQLEGLDDRVQEIEADGGEAIRVPHDVSVRDSWSVVIDETLKNFGKIDGLVNNAGISSRPSLEEISPEAWDAVIGINQSGVLWGMQAVVPHMKRIGGGSIVNVSSIWAHTGGVGGGNIGYVATKTAVLGMTRNAALDLGKYKIRVNSISPGYLDHLMKGIPDPTVEAAIPRIPLGQLAPISGMSGAVAFLLSSESEFITGVDLLVDGGLHLG